jgi:hypothetical protein
MIKKIPAMLLGAGIALTAAAQSDWTGSDDTFTLPLMSKAPTIDGKISPKEWRGAIEVPGFFLRYPQNVVETRSGRCMIGYNKDKLFMAILTELPPDGKPVATVRRRDGKVFYDDNIEIWLDPNRLARDSKGKKASFYQFIGNSIGTILDIKHTPGKAGNENWNGNWSYKNSLDKKNKVWVAELSIPWKSLGINNPVNNKLGLLISRNWKRPSKQTPWFCSRTPYAFVSNYPVLNLVKTAPVIRIPSLGKIFDRELDMKCEIYNPSSKPVQCTLNVDFTHSDMPAKKNQYKLSLPAHGSKVVDYNAGPGTIHNEATHTLKITCFDSTDKKIFSRHITWKLPVNYAKRWRLTNSNSTDFFFSYYPYLNQLTFLFEGKNSKKAEMLIEVKTEKGSTIAAKKYPLVSNKTTGKIKLPSLPDGKYVVICKVMQDGKAIKTIQKELINKRFAWEHNKLGVSSKVFPPFKPLQVSGRDVKAVMRQYQFNDFGLWSKVTARSKELLAAPMNFTCGEKWLAKKCRIVSANQDKVIAEGEARTATFRLQTVSTLDYDGCMKVEMTLIPLQKNTEIKNLSLNIPLKSQVIHLMHIIKSGNIRSNPAITVPQGQGVVWKSLDHGNGYMLGNMHPYIWLGEMDRGLAWFADNDRGWNTDDKTPAQELIRKNGILTFKCNFIDKPLKLTKPRKIVFGLQASPVKPMPADWRKTKYKIPPHGGSNMYWAIPTAYAGKYPVGNDWKIIDEMVKARKTGIVDSKILEQWLKHNYAGASKDVMKMYRAHIRGGFYNMIAKNPKQPKLLYFEEHCQDRTSPEWEVFQDEWGSKDFTARKWFKKLDDNNRIHGAGVRINTVKSYQDFALWYVKKWNEHGIGIYCDNTFPRNNYDLNTSAAYKRADGQIQPSAGIWDLRDYHKRMWILQQQVQPGVPFPLMKSLHITNGMLIPVVGWSDILLDLEWTWEGGTKPFPTELLEIESTGRQAGCYPHIHYFLIGMRNMYPNGYRKPYDKKMARAEWGMRSVYEILRYKARGVSFDQWNKIISNFGYGTKQCRVYNYWEDNYPLTVSNNQVKTILLKNGSKYMVIVQSWLDTPCKTNVAMNRYAITSAFNSETGKAVQLAKGKLQLSLEPYGMRIIEFKVK